MDIFSIPEMTLLAVANDYFITNDIEYDPVHLFKDVSVSRASCSLQNKRSTFFLRLCSWDLFSLTVFIQLEALESAELSKT